MPAPSDPAADVLACLLAIIEGLCRLLAEQAAEAGAGVRARCLTRLALRLRRMAEDAAASAPGATSTRAAPTGITPAGIAPTRVTGRRPRCAVGMERGGGRPARCGKPRTARPLRRAVRRAGQRPSLAVPAFFALLHPA